MNYEFGPDTYKDIYKITSFPDKIFIGDVMGGFDANLRNSLLDHVGQQASNPITVKTYYITTDAVKQNYPNLKFVLDQDQTTRVFQSLQHYHTHPVQSFKNFLCSFNGSPHVSRKLLVSAIKKFGWFDKQYSTKNFSFDPDTLDGHLQDLTERFSFYSKFFSFDPTFLDTIYTKNYQRYNHVHNINTLETQLTQSFIHLVSESMATSYHPYLSEKPFYSIVTRGLFLSYAQPGYHAHFEKYFGFKKYTKLFDYRFDTILNPIERLIELLSMISKFSMLTTDDWHDLYNIEHDTIEYNYDHYHSGNYMANLAQWYE